MSDGVDNLYRTAIEKMAESTDAEIERLRHGVAEGEGIPLDPAPEALARNGSKDLTWGEYAFSELRNFGFIRVHITKFEWYRPTELELWEEQAALAAIETTAIVRLSSMNATPAMPELRQRASSFERVSKSGEILATLLEHQKMMLTIVAAIGETQMLEEYAKRANVALIYARSRTLEARHIEGMTQSANTMLSFVGQANARTSAAAAVAMRVHPSIPLAL